MKKPLRTDLLVIWKTSERIEDWSCDVNPETGEIESNGGIEHLIYFKPQDGFYLALTDRNDIPYKVEKIKEDDLDKSDFISIMIQKFKKELNENKNV